MVVYTLIREDESGWHIKVNSKGYVLQKKDATPIVYSKTVKGGNRYKAAVGKTKTLAEAVAIWEKAGLFGGPVTDPVPDPVTDIDEEPADTHVAAEMVPAVADMPRKKGRKK